MIITEIFLVKLSFNIVRSGDVYVSRGVMANGGVAGYAWARPYRRGLYFDASAVSASNNPNPSIGFNLRCLAN